MTTPEAMPPRAASCDVQLGYRRGVSSVGDRIEQLLKSKDISARELARRSGLGETQVSVLVTRFRKNPHTHVTIETLRAIAQGANVSLAWLTTGEGSPDSDDTARTPSTTEDPEPIMANVPGWAEVERADSEEHPDITDSERKNAREVAKYMLHRPAVTGDLWELVRQMRRVNDPVWLAQKLQESNARVQALLAKAPAQLAWEREQIAKKAARGR